MKIWVLGRGYPTPENRMNGSFELEQAKLLARNGFDVTYISLTLSFFSRKDPRGFRSFEDNGVKIFAYSHFFLPSKTGLYLEGFIDKCWRLLFENAECETGLPDIIHIHYPSLIGSVNEISKYKKQGVRIFITEHWSSVLNNHLRSHELKRLIYYASNANCIISVSELLQDSIKRIVDVTVPMRVVPNIVSPLFFDSYNSRTDGDFVFIVVGRLVSLKQFDIVIKCFLEEFSGNNKVRLRIIGDGKERNNLKKLASNSTQISFAGSLPLSEVAKEIANANALISFSKYETFAVPVAESWACGKPVIVSRNSGVVSLVSEQLGIVVDENDQQQLRNAIRQIHSGYNKFDSRLIKSFAKEHFSDFAIFDQISELYNTY